MLSNDDPRNFIGQECPRCLGEIETFPALSRTDNKTNICSPCGSLEAMQDFFHDGCTAQSKWPTNSTHGDNDYTPKINKLELFPRGLVQKKDGNDE